MQLTLGQPEFLVANSQSANITEAIHKGESRRFAAEEGQHEGSATREHTRTA
jgi:hypothetical protein